MSVQLLFFVKLNLYYAYHQNCLSLSLFQYKSYEDDLNSAMTSLDTTTDCDVSLSEELASLLAEDSEPPAKKQVHCQGMPFVLLFVLLHRHIMYT